MTNIHKFYEMLQLACLHHKKFGMFISLNECNVQEFLQAAPFLASEPENRQIYIQGWAILLYDSQEEMEKNFRQCVGDEGPTSENPYNGSARVYALTCDNEGQLLTENT